MEDRIPARCFFGLHITPMPTAVIAVHTPTGFVIAADGRSCRADDLSVITDTAQKVFEIKSPACALAFAVMGTAEIVATDESGEKLNLVEELLRLSSLQNPQRSKNLIGFMTRICCSINQSIRHMKDRGRIDAYPDYAPQEPGLRGTTISTVLVCGYFRGYPELVEARFFHDKQTLRDPDIRYTALGDERIYGSTILGKLIESGDPRFSKYHVQMSAFDPPVQQVVEFSAKYIEAHADPAALALDPRICRAIGGRIHIATVTRQDGFRWVQGFEPVGG
jgi:hypothetical protein